MKPETRSRTRIEGRVATALLALSIVGAAPALRAGVPEFSASLSPAVTFTEAESTFTVDFFADASASGFNGYEITIQFDPGILAFESVSQGEVMLDPCSHCLVPCGNCGACTPFIVPAATGSTITYTHVLLCAGVSVEGPGDLSHFRFRAVGEGTSPLAIVSDPDCSFFDAGFCVNPADTVEIGGRLPNPRQVVLHDATVVVGPDPTGAGVLVLPAAGFAFRPNPFRGSGEFRFDVERAAVVRLDVVDATGRRVFEREWAELPPGAHAATLHGIDRHGAPLAAGVYFARLVRGSTTRTLKITLVR